MNLEQEHTEKAQVKLKVVEYVLGLKGLEGFSQETVHKDILSLTLLALTSASKAVVETMRKLQLTQFSTLRTEQLQMNISAKDSGLTAFLNTNMCDSVLPVGDVVEWSLFIVDCLKARLYYICEAYDHLDKFYEQCYVWLPPK